MNETVVVEIEEAPMAEVAPITEAVAPKRKNMQLSMENSFLAFQTIVSRADADYISSLAKLLSTFAECASEVKK